MNKKIDYDTKIHLHKKIVRKATLHSSEIRGLCLMKCSSETIQNLPYFWNTKIDIELCGILYSKSMANFEAFCWKFSSSINILFLKSEYTFGQETCVLTPFKKPILKYIT